MERSEWLKLKRHSGEERYDHLWSPIYDENWGSTIDPVHAGLVTHLAHTCPADGSILDAACGTGEYWPILLASGREFCGIDQSQGMLDRAHAKFPQVKLAKIGLQELPYQNAFDVIICMDALEMVFPEDWPRVLHNFHRALKRDGQLYFSVEIMDGHAIELDYQAGIDLGIPIVYGESVFATGQGEEDGGYHYYPSMDQVRNWIRESGFKQKVKAEANDYHHFWLQKGR